MKKLRSIIIVQIIGMLTGNIVAQQDFFMSQSFVNPSMINPSLTAIQDHPEVGLFNRYQWLGSESKPNTQQIIFSTTYNKPAYLKSDYSGSKSRRRGKRRSSKGKFYHAFNASIINDRAGAFNKLETRIHWSPQIRVSESLYAALGPTISLSRFQLNPERLNFRDGADEAWSQIQNSGLTTSGANISFAGNLQSKNFYVGIGFRDALNQYWNKADSSNLKVDRNLVVNGSYRYDINELFRVSVAAVTRLTINTPIDHSLAFRVEYNNFIWMGLGYRSSSALNISCGVNLNQKFNIVYTTEKNFIGFSGLGLTHEFYLSYRIPTGKKSKF
mgnify:FL=1